MLLFSASPQVSRLCSAARALVNGVGRLLALLGGAADRAQPQKAPYWKEPLSKILVRSFLELVPRYSVQKEYPFPLVKFSKKVCVARAEGGSSSASSQLLAKLQAQPLSATGRQWPSSARSTCPGLPRAGS